MSQKERQRWHLVQMVIEGKTTLKEASRLMGVTYRHSKRIRVKSPFDLCLISECSSKCEIRGLVGVMDNKCERGQP